MSGLSPISKDEAKEALERAAWTEPPPDRALRACYELAEWLVRLDDPEDVLAREERRTLTLTEIVERARAAVGDPPRLLVHNFETAGGMVFGADQELAVALDRIDGADEVGWVEDSRSVFGHDLVVRAGEGVYYYSARRPTTPTERRHEDV